MPTELETDSLALSFLFSPLGPSGQLLGTAKYTCSTKSQHQSSYQDKGMISMMTMKDKTIWLFFTWYERPICRLLSRPTHQKWCSLASLKVPLMYRCIVPGLAQCQIGCRMKPASHDWIGRSHVRPHNAHSCPNWVEGLSCACKEQPSTKILKTQTNQTCVLFCYDVIWTAHTHAMIMHALLMSWMSIGRPTDTWTHHTPRQEDRHMQSKHMMPLKA